MPRMVQKYREMHSLEAVNAAISVAGGIVALAKKLGVSQQQISLWQRGNGVIQAERALMIEAATNGEITRKDLRPDLYEGYSDEMGSEQ